MYTHVKHSLPGRRTTYKYWIRLVKLGLRLALPSPSLACLLSPFCNPARIRHRASQNSKKRDAQDDRCF